MAILTLSGIIAGGKPATPDQLINLFQQYVCETTCPSVIRDMNPYEVKRLICIRIFDHEVIKCHRDRKFVMKRLRLGLGVSSSILYRLFPASQYAED